MMPVRRTQSWLPSIFNDFFDNDWMVKANATAPAINVFETEKEHTNTTSWNALKAASQDPNPVEITSNTQWSINYNNTDLTAEVVLRRNWDDVVTYDLNTNTLDVQDK